MPDSAVLRVAVIYPYFAHYREPLLHELMRPQEERSGIEYTLISGRVAPDPYLKLVDPRLYETPVREGGLRWRYAPCLWIPRPVHWQRGLLRLAWSREFDVLVLLGSYYSLTNWLSAPLGRMRGKRVIWWTIGQRAGEPSRLQRWLKLQFLRLSSSVLFYGHRDRAEAIADGMDPDRLHVVYNSMPLPADLDPPPDSETEALRRALFPDASLPVLLYSGRLREGRQIDLLLRAASTLNDEHSPVNVLIIGDGPARASLEQLARELGIKEQVHLEGSCYDPDRLARLFHASDLCVAPGGIGLLCIQALGHGLPCITHDDPYGLEPGGHGGKGPESEAIVPGRTGLLFRRGDPDDLLRCIRHWFSGNQGRAQVRRECRRMIDRYYNPRAQAAVIDAAVRGVPASQVVETEDFAHVLGSAPAKHGGEAAM